LVLAAKFHACVPSLGKTIDEASLNPTPSADNTFSPRPSTAVALMRIDDISCSWVSIEEKKVFTNKDAKWDMVCFPTKMTDGNCTFFSGDAFQLPSSCLHQHRDYLLQRPYTKSEPRSSTWNCEIKHATSPSSADSTPCAELGTFVTSSTWDTGAVMNFYTHSIGI
jgi:hypothetical protein